MYIVELNSAAPLSYEKLNSVDIVLFCGSPGAGKSSFYWRHLQPHGYGRVNQDILKTVSPPEHVPCNHTPPLSNTFKQREKCIKAAEDLIGEGTSVVVGKILHIC